MLSSMLYFIVVALLFSAAALSAERVARLTRRSSRWIWAVALVASALIPAAMSSVSIQLPEAAIGGAAPHAVVLREATSVHLPAAWRTIQAIAPPASLEIDALVRRGWITASIVLLAGLAASGALPLLRQRCWVRSVDRAPAQPPAMCRVGGETRRVARRSTHTMAPCEALTGAECVSRR